MSEKIIGISQAFLLGLIFLLIGCSKGKDEGVQQRFPTVYAKGSVAGEKVEKSIGSNGGSISSADGRLMVTVPAGAVTENVVFSITPITNTNPMSSGDAYRLEPENRSFQHPVQITLNYGSADLVGTIPEALYLGFQNQLGHWNLMKKSEINTVNKTITVESDHFSDWGIVEDFNVRADKDIIQPGESVQLTAYKCITASTEDSLLAPLVDPDPFDLKGKVNWRNVASMGVLISDGAEATYTAHTEIPANNPILIETSISGIPLKNPVTGRVYSNSTLLILTPITIAGGSVVMLSYKGTDYVYTNVVIGAANGKLTVQGVDANWKGIHLVANGNRAGAFAYGGLAEAAKANATINVGAFSFGTEYLKCNIPGEFYSGGSFVVSKWADVGELVKGSFSGTVYSRNPPGTSCPNEPEKHNFSGVFEGLRQY
jgi:hypothetical protein